MRRLHRGALGLRAVLSHVFSCFSIFGFTAELSGQATIASSPGTQFFGTGDSTIVRDAAGRRYVLHSGEGPAYDGALRLGISTDGGQSWSTSPVLLNDLSSGLSHVRAASMSAALGIDDRGVLHLTWVLYSAFSLTPWRQFYRSCDPLTGTCSPIVDLNAQQAVATDVPRVVLDLAVDASNNVWIIGPSSTPWAATLLRSTQAYATGSSFVSVGSLADASTAPLQLEQAALAIDVRGWVHCLYGRMVGFAPYAGIPAASYEHRIYDPQGGWRTPTVLGSRVQPDPLVYSGTLSTDALGNVHAVLTHIQQNGGCHELLYRRWDASGGWGPAILLNGPTVAYGIYDPSSLICNESTGRVTLFARFDETGTCGVGQRLRVFAKDLGDPNFRHVADVTAQGARVSGPSARGSLFPVFQRAGADLELAWTETEASGNRRLWFQRLPECRGSIARIGAACVDGAGARLALSFAGAPCLGGSLAIGVRDTQAPSFLALGLSDASWNGIPLPLDLRALQGPAGCAVYASQEVLVGPIGVGALVGFALPTTPLLIGRTVYAQALVLDPRLQAALPIATSDGLALTFER